MCTYDEKTSNQIQPTGRSRSFQSFKIIYLFLLFTICSMVSSCGKVVSSIKQSISGPSTTVQGVVIYGAVKNGTVTGYAVNSDGSKGSKLGSASTDDTGAFTVKLSAGETDPVIIECTGGTYIEEGSGAIVTLSDAAQVVVPAVSEVSKTGVSITPATTMGAKIFSAAIQATPTAAVADIAKNSNAWVASTVGISDIVKIKPVDLSVAANKNLSNDDSGKYTLFIAGLSNYAKQVASNAGLSSGSVTSQDLVTAYSNAVLQGNSLQGAEVKIGSQTASVDWKSIQTSAQTYATTHSITTVTVPTLQYTGSTTLVISDTAPSSLAYFNYTSPQTFSVGTAITSMQPSNKGGAATSYSVSPSLPRGLSLNTSTGIISGTPAVAASSAAYTVTASNSKGSTTAALTIIVEDIAPSLLVYSNYSSPQSFDVNTPITSMTPSNSGGTVTVYSVSPSLPTGLSLDALTGVISGTPTSISSSSSYTVTASNSKGSTTQTLNLAVADAAPSSLTYSNYSNPQSFTKNSAITSMSPSSYGGTPTSYSVSPSLPTGLSLNTSSGVISGTPSAITSSATYTVTASNNTGSTTKGLVLVVNDVAPSSLSYSNYTSPQSFTKDSAITSMSPSSSGGTVTSYSVSPSLPSGLSLNTSTGVISGTPTAVTSSASYTVTATNTGGSTTKALTLVVNDVAPSTLAYTNYSNPNTYTVGTAITSMSPSNNGGTVTSYSVSPSLPSGLALDTSTGVISGTPTAAASSTSYTVTATNSGGSTTKALTLVVNDVAPSSLSYTNYSNPNTYTKNSAITSMSPSNSGGTVTSYSVSPSLPTGLSLNTSTGVISGTPTAVTSSAAYTVTATNSGGSTTKALTLVVNDIAPSSLSYSNYSAPQSFYVSTAITSMSPSNSGGTVTSYSVSPSLPSGLSLNTSTGVISGTPSATASNATYTVTATNTGGSTTADLSLTVLAALPTAPTGVSATSASGQLTVSWTAVSGATSYNLYYGTSTGVTTSNGTKISAVTSPYTWSSLTNGTTYYFILTAVNSSGEGTASSQASGTPSAGWAGTKQLGVASTSTLGNGVAVDSSGNIFIAGYTHGGLDGNTLSVTGARDFYVTKYDSSGTKQWTSQLGVTGGASKLTPGNGVATDSSGNVFVTGSTTGGLDGNTLTGQNDMFVTKYNSSGTKQWTKQLGVSGYNTYGYAVTTDSSGNIFVTGTTSGGLDGNNLTSGSYGDLFLTKYNSAGTKQWTKQLGAGGSADTNAKAVTTDSSGNIFVAGYVSGNLDGNTLAGNYDLFVTKYNSSGTKQWTKQLGVTGSSYVYCYSVAVDSSGNIFLTGKTSAGLDGNTHSGSGAYDFFLTKYDSSGTKQWTKELGVSAKITSGNGVSVDSSGNIFVGGSTTGGLDGNTVTGTKDFFVTKYNSSGTKQWTKQLGVASKSTAGNGVVVDSSGNIFIGGDTTGGLDGNTATGTQDFFITKYNSSGTKQ